MRRSERRVTLLDIELKRMENVCDQKLNGYKPYSKGLDFIGIVAKILCSNSKGKGKIIDSFWKKEIYSAVEWAVKNSRPINISIAWACGIISLSRYKFRNPEINLPRLADIWTLFWFKMLNKKVKTVYSPGIKLVIIDEVPHGILIGRKEKEIKIRQEIIANIAKKVAPFITIVSLPFFKYENGVKAKEPLDSEVLTILGSMDLKPEEEKKIREALDLCYVYRKKPWGKIKEIIPKTLWEKAFNIKMKMNRIDAVKKNSGFSADLFDGSPFIDGCIVDKGRWSPDIWNFTFPQHGGTILDTSGTNRFSVSCLPESRLNNGEYLPVLIKPKEFQKYCHNKIEPSDLFPFYWEKEK